jgi:hypothetical protein
VTSHAQDEEPRAISRRRIVRSAATLAWTVPAIQVATAIPAFAASGCCDLLSTGSAQWRPGELNYIDIPLNIQNGCATAVTGLTVILTICGVEDITYTGSEYLPAGWTQAGTANQGLDPDGSGCYTLAFTSAQILAGHGATSALFTVKTMAYTGSGNHRPAGSIIAQVSTAGCTSASVPIVLPQVG